MTQRTSSQAPHRDGRPPSGGTFVPVLTVMVDYGNAPFLWLLDSPDQRGVGVNVCDGVAWDASMPMPLELWHDFAEWAIGFDRTAFYREQFDASGWDWASFHARGMQLARRLKDHVGSAYRVVYDKPVEDPGHQVDGRTELLADGALLALAPL